jgi:hypothetical protein
VYVRIALPQDFQWDAGNPSGEAPVDAVRAALAGLSSFTATPSKGYAAVWEGWTNGAPAPQAPRVDIPNRVMLLFTGPVEALRDAPALAWYGSASGVGQGPHLVWPEDQAWCLACEVDEEIEFTAGCSEQASQALARALPGAVRRVRYGEPAPFVPRPGLIPAPAYQAESDVGARAWPGADRPVRHGAAVSPVGQWNARRAATRRAVIKSSPHR